MSTFCGLTIHSVQADNSLSGQGSLRVTLVEDPAAGDAPDFPEVGQPVYFTLGSLVYNGILTQVQEEFSTSGLTYTASVVNPSEILDASPVVLDSYFGSSPLTNVQNIFGALESTGFGASRANAVGMLWSLVASTLNTLINNPASTYGGPIVYRGVSYGLDISSLPSVPASYRIGTPGASVKEIIEQICKDAGCDVWFSLDGLTVVANVIDRTSQPALGALTTAIESLTYSGLVSRFSAGTENRAEPCSKVLVGGSKSTVYVGTTAASYWGDYLNGAPIVGIPYSHPDLDGEFAEQFKVPALGVEHIVGNTTYLTNTIEMRAALSGLQTWQQYCAVYKGAILPDGAIGAPYSLILKASGPPGPYTFTITDGSLPPGLAISGDYIVGTPTTTGDYNFRVSASDGHQRYTITILGSTVLPAITGTPPDATCDESYTHTFSASGANPPFVFLGVNLPPGLSLSTTGVLSGTPTSAGYYNCHICCTNNNGQTSSLEINLTVAESPTYFTIEDIFLPEATVDEAYFETLTALGGIGAITWTLANGVLPNGISLTTDGEIESDGSTLSVGSYQFQVRASDSLDQHAYRQLTLKIVQVGVAATIRPFGLNILAGSLFTANSEAVTKTDLINDSQDAVLAALDDQSSADAASLFAFVRGLATTFYGRKFLVQIPSISVKLPAEGDETTTYSQEPVSAGYLPNGAADIGLDGVSRAAFEEDDGRVVAFAAIPGARYIQGGDFSPDSTALSGEMIFTQTSVNPRLYLIAGVPFAKVQLPTPAFVLDELNGGNSTAILFGSEGAKKDVGRNRTWGTLGIALHPQAIYPTYCGVPLRSNVDSYGPWLATGGSGKVVYERNEELTPWNYGSLAAMEAAAEAQVSAGATSQTIAESGSFTAVGLPAASPGAILAAGCPPLQSVDVQYGTQGLLTTYNFTTYTAGYRGAFHRQAAERMRALALTNKDLQRKAARLYEKRQAASEGAARARAAHSFRQNAPKYLLGESPYDCIVGAAIPGTGSSVRVSAVTSSYEEALVLARPADADQWRNTAFSHLSGLVRGYSAEKPAWTGSSLASYRWVSPTGLGGTNTTAITSETLFPFPTGNDVEIMAWGASYTGTNAFARNPATTSMRPIGLKGPLVITGFGPGTDGRLYPTGSTSSTYVDDYARRSDLWPTGPMDPLWEPNRGVWTVHDVLKVTIPTSIAAGATGTARVGGSTGWTMTVTNQGGATIPASGNAYAVYLANENKFVAIPIKTISYISEVTGNIVCNEDGTATLNLYKTSASADVLGW